VAAKTLFLLRHAKSSWKDPGLDDHERPLAKRGRRAAKLLREHLRHEGIEPDLVLCSPARRARETLERVKPPGEVRFEDGIYGASSDTLLKRLQDLPDDVGSAMVIGHNPGLEDLARDLSGASFGKFPTGALATLTFAASWWQLGPGKTELTGLVTPKQLAAG
jgi:phosphohistidine phosphatase